MPADHEILRRRLRGQLIGGAGDADPSSVVRRLCAMQAQDYHGALWAVGLRSAPGTTAADVEAALSDGRIVRTWPMRGTLHLVAPEDVRWMLALLAPRVRAGWAGRHAQLGLTADDFERADPIVREALAGGAALTRAEVLAAFEAGGVSTEGQRGYHLLVGLAQTAAICLGPMRGRQQTFVLLDEWAPAPREQALERPEALARLASRYFAAHGPATAADFAWWAGITKADARVGIDGIAGGLACLVVDGATYWFAGEVADATVAAPEVHLLPAFDEYLLGYTDRRMQLGEHHETYRGAVTANGMLSPTVLVDGRVVGTWRRTVKARTVDIAISPFRPLGAGEERAVMAAAERYGHFVGREAVLP